MVLLSMLDVLLSHHENFVNWTWNQWEKISCVMQKDYLLFVFWSQYFVHLKKTNNKNICI